ncbi:dihydrofolate reductase family protein [Pseudonocardia sp. WMMC193]|uniref:dihydrofolate reductase family protein n=1 Tax=Pseudonocardia sp. WMMC193 TaxID=2911965 RepID=UPI001F2EAF73|nr:dihydrofolate reductase family protein [Pseudonocardia sp. WMMC193]MCF7551036.1 dihydrofolate reductase family protein [Pseudonocardia sp. WMMC193]
MGIVRYGMNTSLDGFVEDASGGFGWSVPDDEVHLAANAQAEETAAFLFGRRMFEIMDEFWSAPERADGPEVEAGFARAYVATPRIVFSDTLAAVPDGCRLVRSADAVAEVQRLRAETDGILGLAGATLAASLADQIDEIVPFVVPTVVGGGKPFLPPGRAFALSLVEHRVFAASGWTMLRYRVTR